MCHFSQKFICLSIECLIINWDKDHHHRPYYGHQQHYNILHYYFKIFAFFCPPNEMLECCWVVDDGGDFSLFNIKFVIDLNGIFGKICPCFLVSCQFDIYRYNYFASSIFKYLVNRFLAIHSFIHCLLGVLLFNVINAWVWTSASIFISHWNNLWRTHYGYNTVMAH